VALFTENALYCLSYFRFGSEMMGRKQRRGEPEEVGSDYMALENNFSES